MDGKEVSDQHHSGGVHYLPLKRQVVVRCNPWGRPYEGLPCATGQPLNCYYDVDGTFRGSYPTHGGNVLFAFDGGTLHIIRLGTVEHSIPLPDVGGKFLAGCCGEAGTTLVFLAVGSKVHCIDYQACKVTRTWDLPAPVCQLAGGPHYSAFALTKEGLFIVHEDGCALVRHRVESIFSCPVSKRLYISR